MNTNEAIKQYQKAQEESRAAYKELQAAREAEEAARQKCRGEYSSLFNKEARENYLNSEAHKQYEAAQEATAAARKKNNLTTAISKAAADNVLNAAGNALRAAILAAPEKFNKPTHFKKFVEEVKAITGERFYIDNTYSCSFYIKYLDAPSENNSIRVCEKNNSLLVIDPKKLHQELPTFTLKEIKKEAKQAEKDAEKIRKAAAKLETDIKAIRAKYNTNIVYMLPDYYCKSFHDSNLF